MVSLRLKETLAIKIPALPRPTLKELQIQEAFHINDPWIKSIARDLSPTKEVKLNLATVLRPQEDYLIGNEYEERIASKIEVMHGYQQARWLVEHQDRYPELQVLLGKVFIDFPSLAVLDKAGLKFMPTLRQRSSRWCLRWGWTDFWLDQAARVAIS